MSPTPTDRFTLDRFDEGERWKEAGTTAGSGNPDGHNDTVQLFDELGIDRGPIADRPTSGTYDDEFYYAVDQRTLWRWDATSTDWNAAAGLGTSAAPIPGTSHFASVSTDQRTVADLTAVLEKTSDQSLSASTQTTIDWDSQDLDTDIYSYDTSTDELTVSVAGDYAVMGSVLLSSVADQDRNTFYINLNGSLVSRFGTYASGSNAYVMVAATLKDLSASDTLQFDIRSDSSGTLSSGFGRSRISISHLG